MVDINSVPYDAKLSIPDPDPAWIAEQNRKGGNNEQCTVPDISLVGKWVIVSGSNSGIGREAVLRFAEMGANVILVCRDPGNRTTEPYPDDVVEECKQRAKNKGHYSSVIEWWQVDFARLISIERFTRKWNATGRPIDILCNNAGMGNSPGGASVFKTEDGFEIVHQVNLLGHVLLTLSVLPALAKAKEPRVICTTSCFHFLGKFNLRNFNGELVESGELTGFAGASFYQNNKLWFQIWLTEFQRRLLQHDEYKHITVHGVHPGYVNSGIWNMNGSSWYVPLISFLAKSMAWRYGIDSQQGSLCILNAATNPECGPDPKIQGIGGHGGKGGGRYFNRIWEETPMPHTKDPDCRQRVWRKVNDELKLESKGLLGVLGLKYAE
jgi:NAD(P)-dependent dehydrogenase (short-subunit alcohol dehydrogenase family)